MSPARGCAHLTAQAYVMEQVAEYVAAVGGMRPVPCGACMAYEDGERGVLAAYPPEFDPALDPPSSEEERVAALRAAVAEFLARTRCASVTILAPARPDAAPPDAAVRTDAYAFLPLPLQTPGGKLRNMLRRAERECVIAAEAWGEDHAALLRDFCRSHALDEGARIVHTRIDRYLASCPEAVLFAARARSDARLLALAVGEYSSLTTAFYMFAARAPFCPPGVADALLRALAREAERRGHSQLNLGLGVNEGIRRFKRKWGQARLLPYVETTWRRAPRAEGAAGRQAPAVAAPAPPVGPLAAYAAPGWGERLRRAVFGDARPFDCLQVEVTSHCPGRCGYCPHTTRRESWRSRHMTEEIFAALHPLARRARRVHLQGWGEPLLNPRFFDFAAAARRVGCAVSTTTCGAAVTGEAARKLVACGLDIVAFSLTGVDEAGNAARAGIPLAAVAAGIHALREARRQAARSLPQIHVAYLLLASQVEEVAGLPDLMARLGADAAVVSTLDYIAAPEWEHEAFVPGDERTPHALETLRRAAARAEADGRRIHYGLPGVTPLTECAERIRSCLYVDADGMLSPCVYCNPPTAGEDERRRVFGDIRRADPLKIWASPAFAAFRDAQAHGQPDAPCASCPKRFERLH